MTSARALRAVSVASFVPAFPLCVAHGVRSGSPAPAVGLVPLALSAGVGIYVLSSTSSRAAAAAAAGEPEGRHTQDRGGSEEERAMVDDDDEPAKLQPVLQFVMDAILAAALMVVLVFSWIRTGRRSSAELAMLAAYATIPLLVTFLVHLYLAVRALYVGLALRGLTQYLAYQVVPPDCPDCGRRLRPAAAPRMPWIEDMPRLTIPTLPAVAVPRVPTPAWRRPKWLRRRRRGESSSGFAALDHGDEEESPYRDEEEAGGSVGGEPAALGPQSPVPEEIVPKKHKKGKSASAASEVTGTSAWES
ncbi:hypothetical protein GGR56DRAFT_672421 [Xylariaceae sp. FL0804]|nr:hypothetical protein GGR56DRAFT_672421 [Xylariaceae sp. FL0804]